MLLLRSITGRALIARLRRRSNLKSPHLRRNLAQRLHEFSISNSRADTVQIEVRLSEVRMRWNSDRGLFRRHVRFEGTDFVNKFVKGDTNMRGGEASRA